MLISGLLSLGTAAAVAPPLESSCIDHGWERSIRSSEVAVDDERIAEAQRLLGEGRYAEARRILDGLQIEQIIERSTALLADNNPQDALGLLEEAARIAPRDPKVQRLLGEGFLQLGVIEGSELYFQDAYKAFRKGGNTPRSLLGAARAAYMLAPKYEDMAAAAPVHAKAGMAAIEAGATIEPVGPLPEKTLFEITYYTYTRARAAILGNADVSAEEVERSDRLFEESRSALAQWMGQDIGNPEVHRKLAELYQWQGLGIDAEAALERGLQFAPNDGSLLGALATTAYQNGGGASEPVAANGAVQVAMRRALDADPAQALAHWYLAEATFAQARARLAPLGEDEDPEAHAARQRLSAAGFVEAAPIFARCGELDPQYAETCRNWEITCALGEAWAQMYSGDLEASEERFLSLREMADQGIYWELQGSLLNGFMGLQFVADAHAAGNDLGEAARIFDILRSIEPQNPDMANNAGFFHRDAGENLRQLSVLFASNTENLAPDRLAQLRWIAGVSEGDAGTDAEKNAFAKASTELMERAQEHFDSSYEAYTVAAALSPEDVRVVNDTALIAVYYLLVRDDLQGQERAQLMDVTREQLERCLVLGEEQLQAEMPEDVRLALQEAWGDAYQNLGHFHKDYTGEHALALELLRKSVEIGPRPRPAVTDFMIPECEAALAESGGQ